MLLLVAVAGPSVSTPVGWKMDGWMLMLLRLIGARPSYYHGCLWAHKTTRTTTHICDILICVRLSVFCSGGQI